MLQPNAISQDRLVDIDTVEIDPNWSSQRKKLSYLQQVGNPNCVECRGIVVHIAHNPNGPTFSECLQGLLAQSTSLHP